MAALEVTIMGGIPARLFRLSFSGEHAYELAVPADYGNMAARAVMQAGEEFGITPYGVEALSIMRIEKGHVAGGELNGTTTAGDLGMGKMQSTKKDYIGRMMAQREGLTDPNRQCVVGIRPVDASDRIRSGAHILKRDDKPSMANDQGYLTSVAWSPMLNMWIGLALVSNGRARHGRGGAGLGRPAGRSRLGRDLRSDAFRQGEQETPCLATPRSCCPASRPCATSRFRAASAPARARRASPSRCFTRCRS
jgi:methylglutamate dehydrogenase subunit C